MTYMTWLQLPHVPRTMQRSDVIIHNGQMSTPFPFPPLLKKTVLFWFHWVLIPARVGFLVVASGGCFCGSAQASPWSGFSCCGAQNPEQGLQ